MSSVAPPTAIVATRFVPLRDLTLDHKNWVNPRLVTGLNDEAITELGNDIKARGIQIPLVVQKVIGKHGDYTNLVLEGQRRVLAALETLSKDAEIPVVDRTVEPIDLTPDAADALMLDMLAVATKREGLSSFELSEVASRLRDRGRTLVDIGKAIGRDESWVSKFLSARKTADPKLISRWRKGDITDEQFKDLASIKAPEKQAEALKETIKARESGDSTEARLRAKELAEQFKREEKGNGKLPATNGVNGHHAAPAPAPTPVRAVTGDQEDLFTSAKKPDAKADKPETPAVKIVVKAPLIEEMIAMADKRPPTADYVKGVMDCARLMVGEIEMSDFSKAWHVYVARMSGKTAKKAKVKPKAKARKPTPPKKKVGKKAKRK